MHLPIESQDHSAPDELCCFELSHFPGSNIIRQCIGSGILELVTS